MTVQSEAALENGLIVGLLTSDAFKDEDNFVI